MRAAFRTNEFNLAATTFVLPHVECPGTTKGRLLKAFPRHASARPIVPQMPMFGALMDPEGACLP
jgi:hypothetical protein